MFVLHSRSGRIKNGFAFFAAFSKDAVITPVPVRDRCWYGRWPPTPPNGIWVIWGVGWLGAPGAAGATFIGAAPLWLFFLHASAPSFPLVFGLPLIGLTIAQYLYIMASASIFSLSFVTLSIFCSS
jgi:hypothetical protein